VNESPTRLPTLAEWLSQLESEGIGVVSIEWTNREEVLAEVEGGARRLTWRLLLGSPRQTTRGKVERESRKRRWRWLL
jgi:hypothetical protein